MSADVPILVRRESRAARRLLRLLRIERAGILDRRPARLAARMIERRGILIGTVLNMDRERRLAAIRPPAELDRVMAELTGEIALGRDRAHTRLQQIGKDLRLSRGEGLPSGIRNSASGHSLGET
jgi:hypothetical protein